METNKQKSSRMTLESRKKLRKKFLNENGSYTIPKVMRYSVSITNREVYNNKCPHPKNRKMVNKQPNDAYQELENQEKLKLKI